MTINMSQFYYKYQIPIRRFARLAHVTEKTLYAYEAGEKIRSDAKRRIEKAVKVVIKHNLIFPTWPRYRKLDDALMEKWRCDVSDYKRRFEELLQKETF